ncbi:MAG: hypothetical protein MSD82_09455 [Prevotella sp.]|nr:hypothetical protein [Prevotella sp.]
MNTAHRSIQSPEALEHLIHEMGFLPFFMNDIPGFSVSEFMAPDYWFPDEGDGVWEWKGPVIIEGGFAYGKFFNGKAGFISMDWFPDFVNYRRSIYRLSTEEQTMLDLLKEHQTLLSKDLKRLCGYTKSRTQTVRNPIARQVEPSGMVQPKQPKDRKESFERAITRLQMGTYVVTADFEYNYDKQGKRYGWGVSRYCTPEAFFGEESFTGLEREPSESCRRLFRHLETLLPWATNQQITHLIG